MATKQDPVFAANARTAPLGDLRAYLRYAERRVAEYDLSPRTLAIVGEMVVLERELVAGAGTPASQKARVWALIARFKESIPGWAGNAGAAGSWAPEDLRTSKETWRFLQLLTNEARVGSLFSILERYGTEHQAACEKAEAMHRFGVPLRATPLDVDQVRALIHAAATPTATPAAAIDAVVKRTPRRAVASTPAFGCPTCGAELQQGMKETPAGWRPSNAFACAPCGATWALTIQDRMPHRRPTAVASRKPVDWRAAGLKAAETRRRNLAARLAASASGEAA